ncbi:MAG TPA: bifunctional alpha,alpha-trehalose-phosphate synthase (UDP-forming)/trehalose-phosphatase [Gemmatimonadaceae bacterium]
MLARPAHVDTGRHGSPAPNAPAGERGQLIVVANRLPITVSTKDGAPVVRRSVGGLATGLREPHERLGGTWVGWPGRVDRLSPPARDAVARRLEAEHLVPVTLSEREVRVFYEGIANGVLWPICHDRLDRLPLRVTGWDVYEEVNERFAEATTGCHRPGDRIWIHDYQLLRTPALVRRRLPHARIGFFLHVPFPNPEIFFALPTRRWLMEGMLGADVIGFHTRRYRGHFTAALRRLYGIEMEADGTIAWEGRRVHLGVFPMGVDAAGLAERGASRRVNGTVLDLRASRQRLLVGIDRLDYSKGIPRRLLALERLLIEHPEWRGRVRLVQVAVPSRGRVHAYRQVRREVDRLIGRINGELGTPSWTPVHYVYRSVPQPMLLALYRAADVMLVTPVRDGMNLVAKEFVASRTDEEGVLVLSELAGAADELTEALRVNPYDVDQMAEAMHQALTMEGRERRDRMRALRTVVRDNDVHRWTASFLEALEAAG